MDELEQSAELPNSDAAHTAAAEDHDQQAANHDDNVDLDSQEQAEEDEEIDIDGKKFALPKSAAAKLQAERLMQADYTRKTQEVADSRKAIEAEREQVKQTAAQQQQFIKEIAKVHALDDQLAEFRAVTPTQWDAMAEDDPVGTQKLQIRMRNLEHARQQAAEAVTKAQNEHALNEQQATAKQLQEAEAYVQREIPGWTPERGAQVHKFASDAGVKIDQAFAKVLVQNPALMKILDQAEKFSQLVKKQAAKPATPAAPPAPVTRVSAARASAAKDPAKMSDAEWMRHREEQRRKR